jgi:organic hydroperoxide reductase OsmC/OhrA
MTVSARVLNRPDSHDVTVSTHGRARSLTIPPKNGERGSDVNGGELLFLALATCYCNDICREAANLGIDVYEVDVEAVGDFGGIGEPPTNVRYHVRIVADAPEREIRALMMHTDTVAEIQNTLRERVPVRLGHCEAISVTR